MIMNEIIQTLKKHISIQISVDYKVLKGDSNKWPHMNRNFSKIREKPTRTIIPSQGSNPDCFRAAGATRTKMLANCKHKTPRSNIK